MNGYQAKILTFMNPKVMLQKEDVFLNGVLGLSGESGEVADHAKKWLFHERDLDVDKVKKELGDVLFYVALAAEGLGTTLEEIAALNIDKLERRYAENNGAWSKEASIKKADENN